MRINYESDEGPLDRTLYGKDYARNRSSFQTMFDISTRFLRCEKNARRVFEPLNLRCNDLLIYCMY